MRKILLFLFVVVMVGGFWLVASYTDRPAEAVTTENALDIQPAPADQWSATTAEARFEALESAMAALRDEWAIDQQARSLTVELQPAIADLTSRVAGLEQLAQSMSSSPDGEGPDLAAMESTLDTLTQELGRLSRHIDDVDRKARRNNRQVRRKPESTRPPFSAEAIDWWGDTPSVVIRDGERTLFLSPGDVLGGWRLTGVDAHSALFERDGNRASLAVAP